MSDRALIIGAGPAGLAAAAAFRRVGISAEVFERAPELRAIGAGLGLQTNALRALIKLGIGDWMVAHGAIVESQEIYSHRGRLLARLPQGEVARAKGVPGVSLLRSHLQEGLRREVDARTIHFGSECIAVEQDADGITAHFADGRRERGGLVVGADGLHSVVRKFMLGESAPRYSGFTSWRGVASVGDAVMPPDVIRTYIGPGAQFGLFPVGRGQVYWAAVRVAAEGAHPPHGHLREVQRFFNDYPAPAAAVIAATPETEVTRTDIHDRDPIRPWTKGRMVLVGDAAHPTTPFMGQGAGIAIEDSIVLAKELSLSGGLGDLSSIVLALQSYEIHRLDRANAIVLESRRRGETFRWTNPVKTALRNTGMRLVPDRKWRRVVEESVAYDV